MKNPKKKILWIMAVVLVIFVAGNVALSIWLNKGPKKMVEPGDSKGPTTQNIYQVVKSYPRINVQELTELIFGDTETTVLVGSNGEYDVQADENRTLYFFCDKDTVFPADENVNEILQQECTSIHYVVLDDTSTMVVALENAAFDGVNGRVGHVLGRSGKGDSGDGGSAGESRSHSEIVGLSERGRL